MLIALITICILLFLSLMMIVIIGIDEGFSKGEWIATLMFIFCFPVYIIVKLFYVIKAKHERAKIRKHRKKLGLDKEENEEYE